MSSTYTALYYHLVFATKDRQPFIAAGWRDRLHDYLGGALRGMGAVPQGIGGVADHVHLLTALKPTHCLSDVMRDLKKNSSVWVAETVGEKSFCWQEGYAAFTVSTTVRGSVQSYIARQEAHHRRRSFREELVEFLRKSGVSFDERYLD